MDPNKQLLELLDTMITGRCVSCSIFFFLWNDCLGIWIFPYFRYVWTFAAENVTLFIFFILTFDSLQEQKKKIVGVDPSGLQNSLKKQGGAHVGAPFMKWGTLIQISPVSTDTTPSYNHWDRVVENMSVLINSGARFFTCWEHVSWYIVEDAYSVASFVRLLLGKRVW